jgi:ATP-grasp N-terminal domain
VSRSRPEDRRGIVFVTPRLEGESLRAARAVGALDDVVLLGITEGHSEPGAADAFRDLSVVGDTHDSGQLVDAVLDLAGRWGGVERIVVVHETLLAPAARASEALGLPGMSESTVLRALDKFRLRQALHQAEVGTAREHIITEPRDARWFADRVGFPMVLKPLTGSGGLGTWRIGSREQLELAMGLLAPSADLPVLAAEHLEGQELCIDTVTLAGEPRFHSLCLYEPTILDALEDPRIQWRCVMPRDISADRYRVFVEQGLDAVRALEVGNTMTHLEGFLLDGGRVCFTDATLRPAGARIGPMLGFAYDVDPYRVWARVAVDGCFDGPWERRYAVGTVFLRGVGRGRLDRVEGLDEVRWRVGEDLVDSRVPRPGRWKSRSYTGDGYITVRHPETEAVRDYLEFIANTVRITYTLDDEASAGGDGLPWRWSHRRQEDRQHCRPAWDDDSLSRIGES